MKAAKKKYEPCWYFTHDVLFFFFFYFRERKQRTQPNRQRKGFVLP
jgi:hypothetical protein